MSINNFVQKIKPFYNLFIILLISAIFFVLGRISVLEEKQSPIKITYPNSENTSMVLNASPTSENYSNESSGEVIGSKNSKKYYYPWCSAIKKTKPENQVKFSSIDEAKQAGYIPGGNCKGLK